MLSRRWPARWPRKRAAVAEAVAYVAVARAGDIPVGAVKLVRAGERLYALANVAGHYYALDNNCPHNGGPLAKGALVGQELVCPWHGWRWSVSSGRNTWPGSGWRVPRLPVRLVGDEIQLPLV